MTRDEEIEKASLKRYGKSDIDGPMLQNFRVEFEAGFLAGIEWERERAKVLVEALEFYSKERTYTVWSDTTRGRGGAGGQTIQPPDIEFDRGEIAKKALKHYQGEGNG